MTTLDHQTEAKLREVVGYDCGALDGEALIAEAYRVGRRSIGQATRLLHISVNDAYGFMKERAIPINYSLADFESDCEGRRELRDAR
ncbi:MAG: hypothetical protein AMXMBFR13_20540 [Phycisphaerae bacterium]